MCKMYYQEALSAMLRDKTLTSKHGTEVNFSNVLELVKLWQYGWMVKALDLVLDSFNFVGSNPAAVDLFD